MKYYCLLGLAALFVVLIAVPVTAEPVTGSVEFIIRSGGTSTDRQIYVKNIADTDLTYPGYPVEIQPCGISLPLDLIPGIFMATVYTGNGYQPEVQKFTIVPGDNKRVVFVGQAYTTRSAAVQPEGFSIQCTLPGEPTDPLFNPECNHRPDHPGCPAYIFPTPTPPPVVEPTFDPECNHRPQLDRCK